MRVVTALAKNTFIEAVRDKILYLLLFFGVFLFGASQLLSPLALGEARRVTLDVGLVAISVFGCLITVFVGHQLIFREVERKTLYFVFARPLRRSHFVWGKFLGLFAVLALSVIVMLLLLGCVLLAAGHEVDAALLQAGLFLLLEMSVLSAIAMLVASFTSPILAGVLTLSAFVIGHASGDLAEFMGRAGNPVLQRVIEGVSWIVPRLDLFNETLPVLAGTGWTGQEILLGLAYGLTYTLACLLLAGVILEKREFTL